MSRNLLRSQVLAGAAALAGVSAARTPARSAPTVFKLSHPYPPEYYIHPRLVQMADTVRSETGGQLDIQIFANSSLGSIQSVFEQIRLGSIQMLCSTTYQGIVPAAQIDTIGFAFTTDQQAVDTFNGALGAFIRKEFQSKGLYLFEKVMSAGFREVASSTKPVNSADDFSGLKIRVPNAAPLLDLFKTLGAAPVTLDPAEMYTGLQTHLVDGIELPLTGLESYRIYEVTKYLSITNHVWSSTWLFANDAAFEALAPNLKASLIRNAARCSALSTQDLRDQNTTLTAKLRSQGMTLNNADTKSMRAKLGPYYARWKNEFGTQVWALLESSVGKLA